MAVSSPGALFLHLYEKLLAREITTVVSLVDYVQKLECSFDPTATIRKAFVLLQELHWGIFKELSFRQYPQLWKELILPHPDYSGLGELKRNISIANIYVAMLDIHGYTRFCQESKSNLSRLRKLDEFLHQGIHAISSRNHALANRERGDEIIVIAAYAADVIRTALEIISSFSKRAIIKGRDDQRNRADYSIILPEFRISAGIAGGNLNTPLIITESGLLSGYLLNTAARLQSRSNELAPEESKVLVTKSVYANFLKENRVVRSELVEKNLVGFLNHGPLVFKGMRVSAYEIIFNKKERYRENYQSFLESLFASIEQRLWQQKIFQDLLALVRQASKNMAAFRVTVLLDGQSQEIDNADLVRLCTRAGLVYENDEDYLSAVELLGQIRSVIDKIPGFDQLVRHYAEEVHYKYMELAERYAERLDRQIEEKLDIILPYKHKMAFLNSRRSRETFEKLRRYARRSKSLTNRKTLWYSLIEENRDDLILQIYSGKK